MSGYSESSITVLKGLEPVQKRPGMYTRTENPLHIIQEVIDNSADEALAGHAKTIKLILSKDGSVTVADNGRGIPTGIHPVEGVSTLEVVFTRLHAGGKFEKEGGDGAYSFSGGLHGVGVSVTNALALKLEVEVVRDGALSRLVFADGNVVEPLHRVKDMPVKASGTKVRVYPNPKYFDSPDIPVGELEQLIRSKAILLPGLKVIFENEITGQTQEWRYEDGLKSYLASRTVEFEGLTPIISSERYIQQSDETYAVGEGAAWALAWSDAGSLVRESYVNLIPTGSGGTHESGLREGVFTALKNFAESHGLMPKGVKLTSDDVVSRMSFILSCKVLDPQFQGQTKDKLSSRDAVKLVSSMIKDPLEIWFSENVETAKIIAEMAIRNAQARLRQAQKVEKKKGGAIAVLPGKLVDCESEDISRNEIFLVEGDSAGGSAKMGRSKEYQALLALRGKVLNTWDVDADRLFGNKEVHDIAVAVGVDPHKNPEMEIPGLRYGKIIILSDADVDGSHIQVLLLTLFLKHFPALIAKGHVYVAQPPLYRIDVPAQGKKRPARKLYVLDEAELNSTIEKLLIEHVSRETLQIARFKGLGEMNPEQLWETTLNPQTRRLVRVEMDSEGGNLPKIFTMLMGKGEASSRRAWLEDNGGKVQADI